jgi:solute:Na+ symporter, SSS family
MESTLVLLCLAGYFLLLMLISHFTSRKSKQSAFFDGEKKSPWYIVAFGMIGATISGVTFVSVPGEVANSAFHYFQFILGNLVGYIFIAYVLLPFYYQKKVTSIYSVLEERTGQQGQQVTSGFFILSKLIGAGFRLFLATMVLHMAITETLGIPFWATVLICLLVMWLYTFRSGIKTVVWTDTLQTVVLIGAVVATLTVLFKQIEMPAIEVIEKVQASSFSRIWEWDWKSPNNFFKQFLSGIFMTVALNGLDQDIMQKNLTCRNGAKARKNMVWFSFLFVATVALFLFLGALLQVYGIEKGLKLPDKTDQIFPFIALNHLGFFVKLSFLLGITAAAFSSADSATTALTTAFCVDFLKLEKQSSPQSKKVRMIVHASFIVCLFILIVAFHRFNDQSVVVSIFKAAGYTYGPIVGIFLFAFLFSRNIKRWAIFPVFIVSPLLTFLVDWLAKLYTQYRFGFELIVLNALFTLTFLLLFSQKRNDKC